MVKLETEVILDFYTINNNVFHQHYLHTINYDYKSCALIKYTRANCRERKKENERSCT